ncbi:MAG: RNA polymerase sigma factor (sigma-70 family) [Planctomycetota bacterium]|jgi:RNA polymerase sigma factor (sigma-70 family)
MPDPHLDALLAEAGWVLTLAKRLARDQAAAEDIAQSTLALALERRPSVDGGLRPWLAKVAHRLARSTVRSHVRRQDREAQAAPNRDASSIGSDEVLERFELQQDLAKRVAALPEPYRGVLIRRYYEGLSVKQIAIASGATSETVRSQLARGLERIRLQYGKPSGRHNALGVFLIAAGPSTSFLSRSTTQIVTMQTSTKIAAATVGLIVATLAVVQPDFGLSNGLHSDGLKAPLVLDLFAGDESDADSLGNAPTEGTPRLALATVATAVADGNRTPATVEDEMPMISIVRARILGSDLKPLAGATLSSIHPDGRARGTHNVAESDGEGHVVLRLPDNSMRTWRGIEVFDMVFAAGGANHATSFLIKLPKLHGDTDLGDIRLEAGGAFTGICLDTKGRGIPGAVVYAGASVITESPETRRIRGPKLGVMRPRTISAADGSFKLSGIQASLLNGRSPGARLWAHAPGHLWTITDPFTLAPRGSVEVGQILLEEVPPELLVQGTVVRPDGLPAAGARVGFASTGAPNVGHVEADESGHFMVIAKDDSPMDLVARDATGEYGMSDLQTVKRGEIAKLQLMPKRIMSVTITDTDGVPIGDAHFMPILMVAPSYSVDEGRLVPGEEWLYVDEVGHLNIEVPGGKFTLTARQTGFGSKTVGPFEYDSAPDELTITMQRGAQLTGRVLAYGKPVEAARVSAMRSHWSFVAMTGGFPSRYVSGSQPVLTDAEGRFKAPVKANWGALGVIARIDGLAAGEVSFDHQPGESVRDIEIHMTEGGAIEGSVIPPAGMEAPGLFIGASRADGAPLSTIVDADGSYRFEGLSPGNWRIEGRLRPVGTELLSTSNRPDDMEFGWNVVVVDRETTKFDVDMHHLVDVSIEGRLRINGGVPISGWTVEVVRPRHEGGLNTVPAVELDSQGRFSISTRPGRVDLRLIGKLTGGATVELLRELQLQGPVFEWEEILLTGPVEERVEGNPSQVRFVHGIEDRGDRELTIVPVDQNGFLKSHVPIGNSSLEIPVEDPSARSAWEIIQMVEVR